MAKIVRRRKLNNDLKCITLKKPKKYLRNPIMTTCLTVIKSYINNWVVKKEGAKFKFKKIVNSN